MFAQTESYIAGLMQTTGGVIEISQSGLLYCI